MFIQEAIKMDEILIPLLRMIERLFVVSFAGMSIYLGYKLFFHIPEEKNNEGKIKLPGMEVVLSRVGPGVFFVAFGTFVLIQSLDQKITYNVPGTQKQAADSSGGFVGATPTIAGATNIQQSTAIKVKIAELNCALKTLQAKSSSPISTALISAFHDAKVALLIPIWNTASWGDIELLKSTLPQDISNQNLKEIFSDLPSACSYE